METLKTISEASDATGLSEDTLRYYERIGILWDVERNASGHRRYSDMTLGWLGLVVRLRATGMSLETIQRYAELMRQGASTILLRRGILAEHKAQIEREAERLSDLSRLLQGKIDKYDAALTIGAEIPNAPCERI
jgi:MerR family transcriptional regulator, aldehyde-responsive regulator